MYIIIRGSVLRIFNQIENLERFTNIGLAIKLI